MLEDVRHARPHLCALMNATSATPGLNACHRCTAVFLDNEREPVVISEDLGGGLR